MQNQVKNAFTEVYKKKYYSYNNGAWLESEIPRLTLYQRYSKDSGNPLSNFLAQAEEKINNFIIYYTTYVAQDENTQIKKLREDLRSLYRRYYNEFIKNKNIIDASEYLTGGETTATFNFTATMVISENLITQIKNKKAFNTKSKDYNFTYKIENININSRRW